MTVTFVSNFINHHQAPLADCLYEKLGMEYHFVQTMPMEEERVNMGWDTGMTKKPYVRLYYEEPEACLQLILDSDVVIFGWTGETRLLTKRMETGKPTLRVSERIYREGQWKAISPKGLLAKYREHIRYKNTNLCMLCAGAYVASDFHLIHAYPDKMFKWGYFPPFKAYAPGELEAKKEAFMQENLVYATKPGETGPLQMVWAGRMIPLKHPEYVVKAAGKLTEQGFHYHVHMIGAGQMEEELRRMVVEQGLAANFTFYGFGTPEQVRELMEKCHIHLFTSNYLEGWGAVVNEGMNSGCVEIASAQAGAVPYLIAHGKNGFVYHKDSYREFEKQVLYVVENWEQVQHVGQNAYETIANLWNAEKAADRLLKFCDHLQNGKIVFAKEGPLSVAPVYCYANNKNIYYNFEMCDIVALRGRTAILDDKPLYASQVKGLTIEQKFFKRLLDVFGSLCGLIVLSPLFVISAICIKLEDGGKVLFKQKRATLNGKIFYVYKFRTMKEKDSVNRSVTSDDDRITKVGRFLRKFRIDELPQLINILKGEMSIVGPRPEMVENVDQYTDMLSEFSYRLRVKAGLTGHAQIAGKYNTSPKDKLVLDLMYIEKYSLWLDIKLIFQTLTVFFKASDSTEAFGEGEEFEFFTQEVEKEENKEQDK